MKIAIALMCCLAIGCTDELDPPWQLDHDRVVAVRAEPPGITSGSSVLDGLVAMKGGPTAVRPPEIAIVASPQSLAGVLAFDGTAWRVSMPSEDQMVAARAELGLPAGSPVPLLVGVAYGGTALKATKTVLLGAEQANPSVDSASLETAPMRDMPELVVSTIGETHFAIELADPVEDDVVWLTSCGTMHDFDLPESYLTVEDGDPALGELAVVVRDDRGGVAWRVWPIRAE